MEVINIYKGKREKILKSKILKSLFYKYKNDKYRRWISRNFDLDNPPLFGHIQIETTNWCNNNCPFCPVNCQANKRGHHKIMSMGLIKKIAKELKEEQFSGKISLYNNNEPLLDKRIPQIIRIFKKAVPDAKLVIMTNGILLDINKLIQFHKAGLDSLIVDNYSDDLKLIPSMQKISDELKKRKLNFNGMSFRVLLRKKNEVLDNRAGNSPNKQGNSEEFRDSFCILPFIQFNINPLGKVSICCYDTYYENILGDISKDKIINVWRNSKYKTIREKILKSRKSVCPCNKCDYVGVYGMREGLLKITFAVKNNKIVWKKVPHI